jgi:TPR repeat protein
MYNSNAANPEARQPGETAEQFFKLGMMCSTGASTQLDMVEAHKWFNIAATLGMKEAMRLRNEIAAEMSEREIANAQRAARDWLVRH